MIAEMRCDNAPGEVHPHSQEAERRPSRLFHITMSVQYEPREAQRRSIS